MLKVFFDTDNIGMITDMLDAEEHSHYPIQLFLSIDEPLKTTKRRSEEKRIRSKRPKDGVKKNASERVRFLREAGQGASQKRERRHSRLPDWIALSRKDERSEDGIASADRVRRDAFVSSRASVCSQRWRKRRDSPYSERR